MPRQVRVYVEGVLYYVTSKCGHEYDLFNDPLDYHEYISLVTKYKAQHGFKLFSYVLMPKHLHMLIELKNNIAISTIMHNINSLYTKLYNGKYDKKGHLFQERFKTVIAEKEIFLLPLTRNIHLHPVWAKTVAYAKDYPYSSYRQFLDKNNRLEPDIRGEIDEVFKLLGGQEKEYENYSGEESQSDHDILEKSLQKRRILGSATFSDRLKNMMEESVKRSRLASKRKIPLPYIIAGGMTVVILGMTSAYFARGTAEFKSKYNKTAALYEQTLELLESEQTKAVVEKRDVEALAWKIRLTEKALHDLREEKEIKLKDEKSLDGYAWNIRLQQTGGPVAAGAGSDFIDTIVFNNNLVSSGLFTKDGVPGTRYSRRETRKGVVEWETIQRNSNGETMNWRGQWNGQTMNGVLRSHLADGAARDYSFTSMGERAKMAPENAETVTIGGAK